MDQSGGACGKSRYRRGSLCGASLANLPDRWTGRENRSVLPWPFSTDHFRGNQDQCASCDIQHNTVPPLDGAKILEGLLPRKQAYQFSQLEPYGFIILVVLLFTGAVNYVVVPPFLFIMRLLWPGLS